MEHYTVAAIGPIVANDFTQVLSDGIGYWATNQTSRACIVYLLRTYWLSAENGGIPRATNGNNSMEIWFRS